MSKPRLLDLFCGAGGAAMGYSRAGFEVVGVDHIPQPDYPFPFIEFDAFDLLQIVTDQGFVPHPDDPLDYFYPDAIHAAPLWFSDAPQTRAAGTMEKHEAQLPYLRDLFGQIHLPWILENATLDRGGGYLICGASVELQIVKHMWFTTSWPLLVPPCSHKHGGVADGLYAAFGGCSSATRLRYGWRLPPRRTMREYKAAADLEWMSSRQAQLASPPAYTELIGHQLMQHIKARAAA